MTVVEVEMRGLARRFDDHLVAEERSRMAQLALITKLDERADRSDVVFARLLGSVAVLVTLGQIISPLILKALGLSS